MIRAEKWVSDLVVLAVSGSWVLCGGCESGVPADALIPSDSVAAGSEIQPSADTVVVRFRNLTLNESVQVEFFATNETISTAPDDLFEPAHQVTRSIGFAGTGIIQPRHFDVIEFPCSPSLTIGTTGGTFVDHESGDQRGVGMVRWAQQGPLALCGAAVSFDYAGDGTDFTTALDIFSTRQ